MPRLSRLPDGPEAPAGTGPRPASEALALDWLESHARIMSFWEDRLIADNADAGLIDLAHRQAAWLRLMLYRVGRG